MYNNFVAGYNGILGRLQNADLLELCHSLRELNFANANLRKC
jgi:hypothetical protein